MNPPALYDALNCAALAVDEAGSGRPAKAMTAWLEALTAAGRAFDPGPEARALAGIIACAAPSNAGELWRADPWRALDTASLAALIAEDGDTDLADATLMDASGLAAHLPCRDALAAILTAIWDESRNAVAA